MAPKCMKLQFTPSVIRDGIGVVNIDVDEARKLTKMWENSLIVYVKGGCPTIESMKRFANVAWNQVTLPKIYLHEEGYFEVQFKTEKNKDLVLANGPFTISKRPMIMKKWCPEFLLKKEVFRVLHVWG